LVSKTVVAVGIEIQAGIFDTNEDSEATARTNARWEQVRRVLAALVVCANLLADYDEPQAKKEMLT